jgi:phage I-like protein
MAGGSSPILCSAMPLDEAEAGDSGVPEWIHLLPAGEIRTQDGRGPYKVASMAALAEQLNAGGKLAVDECHSTDLAAPKGSPAPARGWMSAFEARDDGLWAQVKWTGQGRSLMEDGAYNGISPVILHRKDGTVLGVLRASLTNAPNLKGLTALHQEGTSMDWKAKLIEWLGLDEAADDAAIEAALKAKLEAPAPAAHSQEFDITKDPAFVGLQSELTETTRKYNTLVEAQSRKDAAAFVDGAIAEGRVGVKAMRERYVAMHQKDPTGTEELIAALPKLTGAALHSEGAPPVGDAKGLDEGDRQVMALMGISEDEYAESKKPSGEKKEAL